MCSHLIRDLRAPRSKCKFLHLHFNLLYFLLCKTLRHPLATHIIVTTFRPTALPLLPCFTCRSPSIIILQYSADSTIIQGLLECVTSLHFSFITTYWSKLQVLDIMLTIHPLQLSLYFIHFIGRYLFNLLGLGAQRRQMGRTVVCWSRWIETFWLELLGGSLLFGFYGLHWWWCQ